jgi:hypothetical protein
MPALHAFDAPDRSQDSAEAWDATYAVWDALDDVPDHALRCLDNQSDDGDWFDHLADLPIDPKIRY